MNLILFSGRHSLNDEQIRQSLIRVPEVLIEIKFAQKILDQDGVSIDLLEQMSLPPEDFCRRLAVRACLTTLSQVGLYKRWKASGPKQAAQLVFRMGYASPETLLEGFKLRSYRLWLREVFAQGNVYTLSNDISNLKFENYVCRFGKETLLQAESIEAILQQVDPSTFSQVISMSPGQNFLSAHNVVDLFQIDPKLDWFWGELAPLTSAQN